jgi:hypothetical protein
MLKMGKAGTGISDGAGIFAATTMLDGLCR